MIFAIEILAVGWVLLATDVVSRWFGQPTAWLDIAAAAAIVGSVAAYHRLRTALIAVEATSDAWRGERDAAMLQIDRLVVEVQAAETSRVRLAAEIVTLNLRPDLSTLEGLVQEGNSASAVASDRIHNVLIGIAAGLDPTFDRRSKQ